MFQLSSKGNFNKTEKFLKQALGRNYRAALEKYGEQGVQALSASTPVDTGKTAASWSYEIEEDRNGLSIVWYNSNLAPTNEHVNIAIILQYGHATGTGGYVQGIDYINPALKPIFVEIAEKIVEEVSS